MPEVPDTVDDALDALSSPSTDEVFDATRAFSSREIGSSAVSRAGGGGGSQPQTATATVTANRAAGFEVSHLFDLGHTTAFYIALTITASDADGETWGTAPGDIAIDTEAFDISADNVLFKAVPTANWFSDIVDGPSVAAFALAYVTARYVRVRNLRILDSDFNVYSGANNPSVTGRFDVEYL